MTPTTAASTTSRYQWISVMGADEVEIDAYDDDGAVLVDVQTKHLMAATLVASQILPDAEAVEQARAIVQLQPTTWLTGDDGLPTTALYDVTDFYGGWDQAQVMRLEEVPA